MAIASYADLYVFMVSVLRGCPQSEALQALRLWGARFFEESEAWEVDLEDIDLVADQAAYDLDALLAYDALIKRIKKVDINDAPEDESHFDLADDTDLVFGEDWIPTEADADAMDVTVVLVPKPEVNEIDPLMLDRWGRRGVVAGALGELLDQDDRAWYAPRTAARYQLQYRRAVAAAKANKEMANKGGDARVVPRQFV